MTAHTNRQTHVQSGRQVRNKQGKHAGGQRQTGLVFITTTAGFWGKWVFLCACTNRRSLPTVTGGLLQWNVVQKNLVFWISVLQIEKVMQIWCMGKSTGPYHLITSLNQCHGSCFFGVGLINWFQVSVKGNCNASAYQNTWDNSTLPTFMEQFGEGLFLFQHDCSPVHKALYIRSGASQSSSSTLV